MIDNNTTDLFLFRMYDTRVVSFQNPNIEDRTVRFFVTGILKGYFTFFLLFLDV